MSTPILPTGPTVTHGATLWLLRWLLRSRTPTVPIDPLSGVGVLPFPWQYKVTVAVGVICLLPFLVLGVIEFTHELVPFLVYFGVFVPLFAAFLWAAYDAMGRTLTCSDSELARRSWLGRTRQLPWSRITSVEYSPLANHFVFRAIGEPAIRVSIYRSGLKTLDDIAARALKHSPAGQAPYMLCEKAKNPA